MCALHKPLETRHINTIIIPRRSSSNPPPPSCSSWGDKCKIREFQNSTDQLPVLKAIRFQPRDIPDSQCRLSATVTLAIIHHSQKCSPPPQRNLGDALHSHYKILYSYFTGLWIQVEENLRMALSKNTTVTRLIWIHNISGSSMFADSTFIKDYEELSYSFITIIFPNMTILGS